MKKIIIAGLLLIALVLTGCNGGNETPADTTTAASTTTPAPETTTVAPETTETEETTEATTEETAGTTTENTSTEMKYCGKCGKAISKDAVVCVHCGCSVDGASTGEQDSDNIGWGFLGFFVPIAGFILWLMWKDKMPKKAKKLGIGALISVCLSAAGSIFSFIPALFL